MLALLRFNSAVFLDRSAILHHNKTTLTALDVCFLILCHQTVTPSPQQYQQDQSQSRVPPLSKAPFDSTSQRFQSMSCTTDDIPGWDIHTYISPMWVLKRADTCAVQCRPGTYAHDIVTNRKVSWQMCFGRPRLPPLEEKKVGLTVSKARLSAWGV